jgi:hypothetical protein
VFDGSLPDQTFPVSSSEVFAPGAEIGISAGYGEMDATIFEGIVVSQSLRITSDNDSRLVIQCRGESRAERSSLHRWCLATEGRVGRQPDGV